MTVAMRISFGSAFGPNAKIANQQLNSTGNNIVFINKGQRRLIQSERTVGVKTIVAAAIRPSTLL